MPLPSAARAATLLVTTDAMIPNPIVKTPAMHAILGAKNQPPASAHVAVELAGDVAQVAELGEPFLEEHDVGRVGGDRRRSAQRDRDVRLLERDRIVDAVADEADLAAFLLKRDHMVGLVGGQDLGEVAVHSQ